MSLFRLSNTLRKFVSGVRSLLARKYSGLGKPHRQIVASEEAGKTADDGDKCKHLCLLTIAAGD
jgi:hypothetical protein